MNLLLWDRFRGDLCPRGFNCQPRKFQSKIPWFFDSCLIHEFTHLTAFERWLKVINLILFSSGTVFGNTKIANVQKFVFNSSLVRLLVQSSPTGRHRHNPAFPWACYEPYSSFARYGLSHVTSCNQCNLNRRQTNKECRLPGSALGLGSNHEGSLNERGKRIKMVFFWMELQYLHRRTCRTEPSGWRRGTFFVRVNICLLLSFSS